jgi:hypothetical protein
MTKIILPKRGDYWCFRNNRVWLVEEISIDYQRELITAYLVHDGLDEKAHTVSKKTSPHYHVTFDQWLSNWTFVSNINNKIKLNIKLPKHE